MSDEAQAGAEVTTDLTAAEGVAGEVLDHAAEFTGTVQAAIAKGQAGLETLQQHEDAAVTGSVVSNTITYFTTLLHELEAGLGLYKANTPVQVAEAAPAAE